MTGPLTAFSNFDARCAAIVEENPLLTFSFTWTAGHERGLRHIRRSVPNDID